MAVLLKVISGFSLALKKSGDLRWPSRCSLLLSSPSTGIFSSTLVAECCPYLMSPLALHKTEADRSYALIHADAWPSDSCGKWSYLGKVDTKDDCAATVRENSQEAFAH